MIPYDCPKQANTERQKVDLCLPRAGDGWNGELLPMGLGFLWDSIKMF